MKTWGEQMTPKHVVTTTRCDVCGRVERGDPEGWVGVGWGHSDWGNDSIESGGHADACSAACLIALLRRIAADYDLQGAPTLYVHLDSFDYAMAKALGAIGSGGWSDDPTVGGPSAR